ncbi:MAG: c-type cytochrome [Crocinitomicaceae bacterium]
MKKRLIIAMNMLAFSAFLVSCGGQAENETSENAPESMIEETEEYDANRGIGKFDETNVKLGALDAAMATKGESIAGTKCTSCHKLTDEKLVGPGWAGVTERRTPHWIMNFITNPDPMIDKDPEVQAQLELCLVRMPNQSLTDDDARSIVEFMRKNDGTK